MNLEGRSATKGRYIYTSRRVAGRVVKEYVGRAADPIVQVLAQADELGRAKANAAVAEVRAEQARYEELAPTLHCVEEVVRERMDLTLAACGFRRRKGKLQSVKYGEAKKVQYNYDDCEVTREFVDHLANRANRGDRLAAGKLRQILHHNPEIMEEIGNLGTHAERSLINLITEGNMVLSESVRHEAEKLRKSLRSEAVDGTLERFLIDHIVLCWLELYFVRTAAMQPQQHMKDARYWDQRQDKVDARFRTALKELATLRELLGGADKVVPLSDES